MLPIVGLQTHYTPPDCARWIHMVNIVKQREIKLGPEAMVPIPEEWMWPMQKVSERNI